MDKNTDFKCYFCYDMINEKMDYHPACLKKFFNSEIIPELTFTKKDISSLALEYVKEKRGLPGVQKKLSLSLEPPPKNKKTNRRRLTIIGYLGGEYILKPPTDDYPQMPEIEDLTMHLAEIANITIADHGLIKMRDGELAYITKRFDRKAKKKIAVEDLCQLSSKLTENKYKSSYENIGKIIRKYSDVPGDDILRFFELILFSFIIGNSDMHLKNFSLLTQNPDHVKLAPFYDLLSTKLLIPEHIDPEELALPLNGKKSNLRKKDFIIFGENLNIPKKVIDYVISNMGNYWTTWENKINKSFLGVELQDLFKKLIQKNLARFE